MRPKDARPNNIGEEIVSFDKSTTLIHRIFRLYVPILEMLEINMDLLLSFEDLSLNSTKQNELVISSWSVLVLLIAENAVIFSGGSKALLRQ